MSDTKVNVGLGITLNLGNYQSLRIDISVEDHVREGETADTAFNRVYKFVEDKLSEKIEDAKDGLDGQV